MCFLTPRQPVGFVLLLLLLAHHVPAFGRFTLFSSPADVFLGRPGATVEGPWALFSNPAGAAIIKMPVAGIGYMDSYRVRELSSGALFALVPTNAASFGIGVSRFGFSLYNQQQWAFLVAREMAPWLQLGARFNLHAKQLLHAGKQYLVSFDMGLMIYPVSGLAVGFHAVNPGHARWDAYEATSDPPPHVASSVYYKTQDDILFEAGVLKGVNTTPVVSFFAGIPVAGDVILRGGVTSSPLRIGIGTGIKWKFVNLDLGFNHHPFLGLSSSFGMLFCLARLNSLARP